MSTIISTALRVGLGILMPLVALVPVYLTTLFLTLLALPSQCVPGRGLFLSFNCDASTYLRDWIVSEGTWLAYLAFCAATSMWTKRATVFAGAAFLVMFALGLVLTIVVETWLQPTLTLWTHPVVYRPIQAGLFALAVWAADRRDGPWTASWLISCLTLTVAFLGLCLAAEPPWLPRDLEATKGWFAWINLLSIGLTGATLPVLALLRLVEQHRGAGNSPAAPAP